MLSFLHIENIAVIKKLDIDFGGGLTVLTGETGAGKSIIIDSICLLMGARSSKEIIRAGEESAAVSAVFTDIGKEAAGQLSLLDIEPDEDGSVSVMRKIFSDGKSQAKINGTAVQASVLREAAKVLINVHSQHESQTLIDPASHIKYLDEYLKRSTGAKEIFSDCGEAYKEFAENRRELERFRKEGAESEKQRDFYEYQLKDIDSVKANPGEDAALEKKLLQLQNAEKLLKGTDFVYRALVKNGTALSACDLIEKSCAALTKLSEYIPAADAFAHKLEELRYEIEDIGERTLDFAKEAGSGSPAEIDRVQERLDALKKLKRKYGPEIEDALEYAENIRKRLEELENNTQLVDKYTEKYRTSAEKLKTAAQKLHEARLAAANEFSARITESLEYLDMHGARVKIRVEAAGDVSEYTASGADRVEFLIAANPGEELKSMSKTASGGELSRVMLAIKSELSGKGTAQTVIFDEIDTGVSGKTAEKIGLKLLKISENSQVFSITHSAQIAALADTHMYIFKAEKDGHSETGVQTLTYEERAGECARITSGVKISEKQLEAARELVSAGAEIRKKQRKQQK